MNTDTTPTTVFHFNEHPIREITDAAGAPWFVAKDICDILGLDNVTNALAKIPERHLTLIRLRSGGQVREMKAVDEPGLYRLVLRSDKPQAEPFMEWVTADVLPTIRRTGAYGQKWSTGGVDINEHLEVLKENNQLLRQTMASLRVQANHRKNFTPDEDARVLHLHGLGYSTSQIGEHIGRKGASVRSCLHRLKQKGVLTAQGDDRQMALFPVGVLGGSEA